MICLCTFKILHKIDPHDAEQWPGWTVDISLTRRVHKSGIFEVASRHASIHYYAWQLLKPHVFGQIIVVSANLGSLVTKLMLN